MLRTILLFFKRVIFVATTLLLLCQIKGRAQTRQIDSLKLKLEHYTSDDFRKVDLLNELASASFDYDIGHLGDYCRRALALAHQLNYLAGESTAYCNLGFWFTLLQADPVALEYIEKARVIAQHLGNSDLIARSLNGLGCYFAVTGNSKESLKYFKLALQLNNGRNTVREMAYLNNVGNGLETGGDFATALHYYKRSAKLAALKKNSSYLSKGYRNIASLFLKKNDLDSALKYVKLAYRLALIKGETSRDLLFANYLMADVYFAFKKMDRSRELYQRTIRIASRMGSKEQQMESYQQLFRLDSLEGNSRSALAQHLKFTELKDQQYSREKIRVAALYDIKFNLQHREEENKHLKTLLDKEKHINKIRELIIWLGVIATVIIVIALFLLKRTYDDLRKKNEFIARQNELMSKDNLVKDKLFSVISHDLRSPIVQVFSMLELVEDKVVSEDEFLKMVPQMKITAQDTLETLDNLLNWSKSQLKGFKVQGQIFDLDMLCFEVVRKFEPMFARKGLKTVCTIDPGTEVYADPEMMKVVVRNLIGNAIKFTPINGTISLEAHQQNSFILVKISDTGIGIPADKMLHLFDNISHTTLGTENEKGTGLGLKLCKDFLELNGGSIEVESTENKGTTFFLKLPAQARNK